MDELEKWKFNFHIYYSTEVTISFITKMAYYVVFSDAN